MNGMRSGIESINPFGVSIMYRFSYRQGGYTPFAAFFSAVVYTTCLHRCHPFGVPLFPQFSSK